MTSLDKIFLTQLTGVLKKIQEQEEFQLEDSARLIAQALVGEGTVFIWGNQELEGVIFEATKGKEAIPRVKKLDEIEPLTDLDRVILFSRTSSDKELLELGRNLYEKNVPFIAVASKVEGEGIESIADIFIDLKIKNGLIPTETGERIGYPYLIASIFVYHHISFLVKEILSEYEE